MSDGQRANIDAFPARDETNSMGSHHRLEGVHQSLRRIGAVAGCEYRLQRHSAALAIAAVVLAMVGVGTAVMRWGRPTSDGAAALFVAGGIALFAVVLLPWPFVRTFERDAQRRFSPVLWLGPLAPAEYALAKGLACVSLALLTCLPALAVGWGAAGVARGAIQPIGLWVAVALVVASAVIPATLIALLCIRLAPRPLLGGVIRGVLLFYMVFATTQTLFTARNFTAQTTFYSAEIGFGPDEPLLLAQRLACLSLGPLCLFLLALVAQLKDRQAASLRGHWLSTIGGVGLATLLLFVTQSHLRSVAHQYVALGPVPTTPIAARAGHFRLIMTLDPRAGQLSSTTSFLLMPAHASERSVLFALNPGLRVRSVLLGASPSGINAGQGVAVPFHSELGWTKVDLSGTPFPRGQPIRLTIQYAGQLVLDRDDYARVPPSVAFGTGVSSLANPLPIKDFAGRGLAFLQGDGGGDWYPLPWTEQTTRAYQTRLPFDDAQISVPGDVAVFCSLGTPIRSRNGRYQSIHVQPRGLLPMAFVAALSASHHVANRGIAMFYQGAGRDQESNQFDLTMLRQLREMSGWLEASGKGAPARTWIGVVVPFIQHPVAGPGLVFLPEVPEIDSLTFQITRLDVAQYRALAQEAATAWWLNVVQLRPGAPWYFNTASSIQTPRDRFFPNPTHSQLLTVLADYSGAVITDRAFRHGALTDEMAQRQATHDATHMPDPVLSLYHLGQRIGAVRTIGLLHHIISRFAQTPAGVQEYLVAASSAGGRTVKAEIMPYLLPGFP